MTLPRNVVLVNRQCSSDCSLCPSDDGSRPDSAAIIAMARAARTDTAAIVVGAETLTEITAIGALVADAAARRTRPLLLTFGASMVSPSEIESRLGALSEHGEFELIWVLDHAHYSQMGLERARCLLRSLRRAPPRQRPHLLFLLAGHENPPQDLLACEEFNAGAQLTTRPGHTFADFLHRHGPDPLIFTRPEVGSTRRPGKAGGEYPLTFGSLVFETTYFCNARCTHCYTSCGPTSSRQRLSVSDARRVIDDAADLPNIDKYCHVAGGEATIFWREMIKILAYAHTRGFTCGITTNGFWGATAARADHKVAELVAAGVVNLELSADAMHQDFIKPTMVSHILRAGKRHRLPVTLRTISTRRSGLGDLLSHLPTKDQHELVAVVTPVHPVGRAAETIPEADLWLHPGIPAGSCADDLQLAIAPDGRVFPCCVGSELCPTLSMGNITEQSLAEIMASTRTNFLLRTLVHAGPAYFAALIADSPFAHKLRPGYANFCQLCHQIFSDPDLTTFACDHIQDRTAAVLREIVTNRSAPSAMAPLAAHWQRSP